MIAQEVTLGEQRVRMQFNLAKDGFVDQLKQRSAELINLMQELKKDTPPLEQQRLIGLAQTAYEEGAMWAVKAATYGL